MSLPRRNDIAFRSLQPPRGAAPSPRHQPTRSPESWSGDPLGHVPALSINIVAGLLGTYVGGVSMPDKLYGFMVIVVDVATFTVLAGWVAFRNRS